MTDTKEMSNFCIFFLKIWIGFTQVFSRTGALESREIFIIVAALRNQKASLAGFRSIHCALRTLYHSHKNLERVVKSRLTSS